MRLVSQYNMTVMLYIDNASIGRSGEAELLLVAEIFRTDNFYM